MLSERELLARVQRLTVTRLRVWVAQGWIKPADEEAQSFSEADLARAALICNLEDELGFAEEDVPVLLNLIDQIHGLRAELMGVLDALEDLPQDVRATVRMRITSAGEETVSHAIARARSCSSSCWSLLTMAERAIWPRPAARRYHHRSGRCRDLCADHHGDDREPLLSLVLWLVRRR